MQAIVNVELDEKSGPGLPVEDRYALVMSSVRKFFTRSIGEVRSVNYTGPDGSAVESTAVITFEFHAPKSIVLNAFAQISRTFNQDCVAVLFDDGEGRLVGPEADRWGGFKIEYFKRPSILDLLKEAA
jgi:hypothetical protein